MKAYEKAGVNLAAADEMIELLKPLAQRTLRPEVLGGLGGFWRFIFTGPKQIPGSCVGFRDRRSGYKAEVSF